MKASISVKKIISVFIAVLLCFCVSSCDMGQNETTTQGEEESTEPVIPGGSLSVPYTSVDSLNPFFTESVLNSVPISLVYRSLYKLDTSFSAVRDLAASETVSGLNIKVYLVSDLVFSDGGELTAEDVVYSFECAKKSYLYSSTLESISSCTQGEDGSVTFTLEEYDENALNALTFPIVERGTAATEDFLPIGNGFYQFSQDGIRLSLKANLKYAGELPEIGTVRLTDVKGNTSPENLVSASEIDFYYSDLADANIAAVNASVTGVYLNNLVYIGVNHENVNLVLASFRQAISYAVDRQAIAESAFRGYARAAAVPFNTSWSRYSASPVASSLSLSSHGEKTAQLLSANGFGEGGLPLELTLICNEGNSFMRNTASLIVQALNPYNINVTVQLLSAENLEKAVKAGEYDLYLAEIKIPATMDLSQFFIQGGAASYGINFENCRSDEEYFRYKNGEITFEEFIDVFNSDMPFIPILYRNGRLCYTRKVTSEMTVTESSIFGDIHNWTFSD